MVEVPGIVCNGRSVGSRSTRKGEMRSLGGATAARCSLVKSFGGGEVPEWGGAPTASDAAKSASESVEQKERTTLAERLGLRLESLWLLRQRGGGG